MQGKEPTVAWHTWGSAFALVNGMHSASANSVPASGSQAQGRPSPAVGNVRAAGFFFVFNLFAVLGIIIGSNFLLLVGMNQGLGVGISSR